MKQDRCRLNEKRLRPAPNRSVRLLQLLYEALLCSSSGSFGDLGDAGGGAVVEAFCSESPQRELLRSSLLFSILCKQAI